MRFGCRFGFSLLPCGPVLNGGGFLLGRCDLKPGLTFGLEGLELFQRFVEGALQALFVEAEVDEGL